MDLLTLFFKPFVWHPERIAVVAALFLCGYFALRSSRRFRAWPLLIAAGAWGLFVPWEWYCKATEANIRVDLLLLCPVLLVITVGSLAAAFWPRVSQA